MKSSLSLQFVLAVCLIVIAAVLDPLIKRWLRIAA